MARATPPATQAPLSLGINWVPSIACNVFFISITSWLVLVFGLRYNYDNLDSGAQTSRLGQARPVSTCLTVIDSPATFFCHSCEIEDPALDGAGIYFIVQYSKFVIRYSLLVLPRHHHLSIWLFRDAQQFGRFDAKTAKHVIVRLLLLHPLNSLVVPLACLAFLAKLPVDHRQKEPLPTVASVFLRFIQILHCQTYIRKNPRNLAQKMKKNWKKPKKSAGWFFLGLQRCSWYNVFRPWRGGWRVSPSP